MFILILSNPVPNPGNLQLGGYQMMVRAEVMRGKFRNSYEKPEPFAPGTDNRGEI